MSPQYDEWTITYETITILRTISMSDYLKAEVVKRVKADIDDPLRAEESLSLFFGEYWMHGIPNETYDFHQAMLQHVMANINLRYIVHVITNHINREDDNV